jgi:uncharacterized cupredoxin-like copper-binding protein
VLLGPASRRSPRLSFTVPPGTYQLSCRVPGHKQAGMVGMLTVG